MKKITMYESEDGTTFETEQEALDHDKLIECEKWYEENKLYGSFDGCKVDWVDLVDWLRENRGVVFALLRVL